MTSRASLMLALMALLAPFVVMGQAPQTDFGYIGGTVAIILGFLGCYLVPLIFAIAFLLFIWGMFKYFIVGATSEDKRSAGKQLILWGVAGFVLMVSVWGIVRVVTTGLNFGGQSLQTIPSLPGKTHELRPNPGTSPLQQSCGISPFGF